MRTDCVGEAAGGLAVGAWAEFDDPKATRVASNLLDYLFFNSGVPRSRPLCLAASDLTVISPSQ